MSQSDREYLLARAARERALAEQAPTDVVRAVHQKLAHEYEVRANIQAVAARADNDVLGLTSDGDRSS
jgi:hypothetical protein